MMARLCFLLSLKLLILPWREDWKDSMDSTTSADDICSFFRRIIDLSEMALALEEESRARMKINTLTI